MNKSVLKGYLGCGIMAVAKTKIHNGEAELLLLFIARQNAGAELNKQ